KIVIHVPEHSQIFQILFAQLCDLRSRIIRKSIDQVTDILLIHTFCICDVITGNDPVRMTERKTDVHYGYDQHDVPEQHKFSVEDAVYDSEKDQHEHCQEPQDEHSQEGQIIFFHIEQHPVCRREDHHAGTY